MVRLRRGELVKLREERGLTSWSQLAAAMGVKRQQISYVVNLRDVSGVRTGTFDKLCKALSTPAHRVELADIIERLDDPD